MATHKPRLAKTCYFTRSRNGANQECVRFGLTQRPEAQIVSSREAWARVRKYLVSYGYRLIEVIEEDTTPTYKVS